METNPVPVLDDAAMGMGVAAKVVESLEPYTEADPTAMLYDLLTAYGNAVGPSPYVEGGGKHSARLFSVIVGRSAKARKGTSRALVRHVMQYADPYWARDCTVEGGLSTGEGLIAALADETSDAADDVPPPGSKQWSMDALESANQHRSTTAKDKRILIHEPEFARVLAAAGRESATLSAVIRQAWDSGSLAVLTRKDPLRVEGAHVSVVAHITLEELKRRLTDTETANGFANRHLFVWSERSKVLPDGGYPPEALIEELGGVVKKALTTARRSRRMVLSEEARELWAELYTGPLAADDVPGVVGALSARGEAQTLRLALVCALIESSPQIEIEHLEQGYALWCFARGTIEYSFGGSNVATGDEKADRLLVQLREAGTHGLSLSEQQDVFGRSTPAPVLKMVRELLSNQGLAWTGLEDRPEGTEGRPTTRTWALAPKGVK